MALCGNPVRNEDKYVTQGESHRVRAQSFVDAAPERVAQGYFLKVIA
jgi:hypothetical protein